MCKTVIFSIVSHGHYEIIQNFIYSMDKYLDISGCDLKIVVRDNLNEIVELDDCGFCVKIIRNLHPRGFGENHNHNFCLFPGDYFFVLNPDLEFISNVKLIDHLSEIGESVYTVNLISKEGEDIGHVRNDLTLINIVRRRFGLLEYETFNKWFSGAFLAFEWSTFSAVGGFDERFWMYVEDCDICLRAKYKLFELKIDRSTVVVHDAQRGSNKSLKLFYYHLRSLTYFFIKRFLLKSIKYDIGRYITDQ